MSLKREKKEMREVKSWVDMVLGYISVCCIKIAKEEPDSGGLNLILPLDDLILPLVSSDVCGWLSTREFHVGYLAGAITMEAFFMKLCC